MSDESPVDGREIARGFLEHIPFGSLVGLRVKEIDSDRAVLELPYKEEVTTTGQILHGGAISTLIDVAATAAAWAAEFPAAPTRWGTASLTVDFLRPARESGVVATAEVTRRGRNLCFCSVEARADGEVVATGLVVYSLHVPG